MSKIKIFIELYNQKQKIIEQSLILEKKVHELEITKQELEKVNSILEQISYFDKLTGIANRHSLDDYCNTVLNNAIEKRTNLALMMIDIDCFKEFNENYVTISIGVVALIPEKTDSLNGIVNKADKALYQAKDKGRNRVIEYDEGL